MRRKLQCASLRNVLFTRVFLITERLRPSFKLITVTRAAGRNAFLWDSRSVCCVPWCRNLTVLIIFQSLSVVQRLCLHLWGFHTYTRGTGSRANEFLKYCSQSTLGKPLDPQKSARPCLTCMASRPLFQYRQGHLVEELRLAERNVDKAVDYVRIITQQTGVCVCVRDIYIYI